MLAEIARAFCVPVTVLCRVNGLKEEVKQGQILIMPPQEGNLYCVRGGESKTLLCGSVERYERLNCTKHLFPGQEIWI